MIWFRWYQRSNLGENIFGLIGRNFCAFGKLFSGNHFIFLKQYKQIFSDISKSFIVETKLTARNVSILFKEEKNETFLQSNILEPIQPLLPMLPRHPFH